MTTKGKLQKRLDPWPNPPTYNRDFKNADGRGDMVWENSFLKIKNPPYPFTWTTFQPF